MDRDEYGASGKMVKGVFTPYAGAAEKQAAAEKSAQAAEEAREAKRKELEALTVDAIRTEYADLQPPDNLKKGELIDFILDQG